MRERIVELDRAGLTPPQIAAALGIDEYQIEIELRAVKEERSRRADAVERRQTSTRLQAAADLLTDQRREIDRRLARGERATDIAKDLGCDVARVAAVARAAAAAVRASS